MLIGGILKGVSSAQSPALKTALDQYGDWAIALGGTLIGMSARQNGVTSEQAGALDHTPADPSKSVIMPVVPSPVTFVHTTATTAPVITPFVSGYAPVAQPTIPTPTPPPAP